MKNIYGELISSLPDVKVSRVFVGAFDVAVTSVRCGFASALREPCGSGRCGGIPAAGKLEGMPVRKLAECVYSDNILEASVGMAAINSAVGFPAESDFSEINAVDVLKERAKGRTLAVIGNFPFAASLKKIAGKLMVFDRNPAEGVFPPEKEAELLGKADVAAISATTLINHSFGEVMSYLKPGAYKLLLGPSTPLTSILFEFGLDAVSGTFVPDVDVLLPYLGQGASYRQLKGKKMLTLFKGEK
ncbi:MAG: DUF364 domain-containing protein [Elusimicrobia bacterium]|nr:DUF364 domain-containing protein [Elusimicrobiota bacterium]